MERLTGTSKAFMRYGMECELTYPGKAPLERVVSDTPCAHLLKARAFCPGGGAAPENILIHGDNLPALKALLEMKGAGALRNSDGSMGPRLAYMDPPFSTRLVFRSENGRMAYDDRVDGPRFIEFLRKRLILLRELLSEDGSIYVHLDWKKVHYVKVVMDEVFGAENFLNDIVWSYGGRGAKHTASQFSRNHDIILWYGKGEDRVFNRIFAEKRIKKGASGYRMDHDGRWFKTSPRGDYTDASIEALRKENRVYTTRNGNLRIKYFLRDVGNHIIEDRLIGDVWDDIPDAMHVSGAEKTGYPTQKPEALLFRIIQASSNEGDMVIDAFAGAGTTLSAAEKLGRRWIGIDSGQLSIDTMEKRLLTIEGTRAPGSRKIYGRPCAPFAVYVDGPG